MKIIVTAKQVPDTNEVKIDPVKHTLIRDGVPSILNPDDKNALEGALALKDQYPGSTVTVISMGPPQALIMLKECIAMGADDAALLSSRAFGGADTCATSTTIAAGIKKIGDYDIKQTLYLAQIAVLKHFLVYRKLSFTVHIDSNIIQRSPDDLGCSSEIARHPRNATV